jgi:hypothetical protein
MYMLANMSFGFDILRGTTRLVVCTHVLWARGGGLSWAAKLDCTFSFMIDNLCCL